MTHIYCVAHTVCMYVASGKVHAGSYVHGKLNKYVDGHDGRCEVITCAQCTAVHIRYSYQFGSDRKTEDLIDGDDAPGRGNLGSALPGTWTLLLFSTGTHGGKAGGEAPSTELPVAVLRVRPPSVDCCTLTRRETRLWTILQRFLQEPRRQHWTAHLTRSLTGTAPSLWTDVTSLLYTRTS